MAEEVKVVEKEIPIGLVHPALLEPFRIRFFVSDEIVKDCEITLNPAHRGIERLMEGKPYEKASVIVEKICGICSSSHLWSSVKMVEMGLKIHVPERAQYIRTIVQELQRTTSHLIFLGHAMEVVGHETFAMRAFLLREMFMDLLYYISGSRVHPTAQILGGVRPRCDIPPSLGKVILETVDRAEDAIAKYVERLLADPLVMSRVTGVGILDYNTAMRLHAVGPTGRASGVKFDWRKDPVQNPAYKPFDFNMVVLDWCDTKARVATRALEIFEQFKILRQAVKNMPDGPVIDRTWRMGRMDFSHGYLEAPRGEVYHSTSLDDHGLVRNYKIRTPSCTNLPSMEEACIGDHLTDAVLTIASCDPCLSCTNRFTVVDLRRDKTRVMTGVEIIGKYGRRRTR